MAGVKGMSGGLTRLFATVGSVAPITGVPLVQVPGGQSTVREQGGRMKLVNGIHVFEDGEVMPGQEVPFDSRLSSEFGYMLVGAAPNQHWQPATEDDALKTLSALLGLPGDQISLERSCYLVSPEVCSGGYCGPLTWCQRVYNPATGHYNCYCLK